MAQTKKDDPDKRASSNEEDTDHGQSQRSGDDVQQQKPEILAVVSGKGGAGKSIIAGSLAYALIRAGHKVLLIDADLGTDGLSHLMLGQHGPRLVDAADETNCFAWYVGNYTPGLAKKLKPIHIPRDTGKFDLGVTLDGILSTKLLFGRVMNSDMTMEDYQRKSAPAITQKNFQDCIDELFATLKAKGDYDYVIVDTRGGFAYQSADVCAYADGFILVSEPDITSLYQDVRLLDLVNSTAIAANRQPVVRSVILNKSTSIGGKPLEPTGQNFGLKVEDLESTMRLEFSRFMEDVPLDYIFPVPLDMNVVKSYRRASTPFRLAPWCDFTAFLLDAFTGIVISQMQIWDASKSKGWTAFVKEVEDARSARKEQQELEQQSEDEFKSELNRRILESDSLKRDLESCQREKSNLAESVKSIRTDKKALEKELRNGHKQHSRELGKLSQENNGLHLRNLELTKEIESIKSEHAYRSRIVGFYRNAWNATLILAFTLLLYLQYKVDLWDVMTRLVNFN